VSNKGSATNRAETEQQAAEYVVALSHDPSRQLQAEVAEWIKRSPGHAVAFARAERAWEMAGGLTDAPGAGATGLRRARSWHLHGRRSVRCPGSSSISMAITTGRLDVTIPVKRAITMITSMDHPFPAVRRIRSITTAPSARCSSTCRGASFPHSQSASYRRRLSATRRRAFLSHYRRRM